MQAAVYPVKVSPQGQITLTKALRQKLGIVKGQLVYVGLGENDSIQINTAAPITRYRGALAPKPGQLSATNAVQEIRQLQKQKLLNKPTK